MLELPYSTSDLPGAGGSIRTVPADFRVTEVPLYEPSGSGDHAYLRIEKTGITTYEACARVARALGVSRREIGYAGLKDARAVAVQTLSVEHVDPAAAVAALGDLPGLRLIDATRHKNKLRLGHLTGNRFEIVLRDVGTEAEPRTRAILGRLAAKGCPNWFGRQRFGVGGGNAGAGRALVRGDLDEAVRLLIRSGLAASPHEGAARALTLFEGGDARAANEATPPFLATERRLLDAVARERSAAVALRTVPRKLLRLLVSAYQSALFNRLLAERLPYIGSVEVGDLAWLHSRGAVFEVTDAAAEQPRADTLEISPSGPLFGLKTSLATGEPGRREAAVLAAEELAPRAFKVQAAGRFDGARRPYRMPVTDAAVETVDDDAAALRLRFALPRGSYATAVLHEVVKTPPAPPA